MTCLNVERAVAVHCWWQQIPASQSGRAWSSTVNKAPAHGKSNVAGSWQVSAGARESLAAQTAEGVIDLTGIKRAFRSAG